MSLNIYVVNLHKFKKDKFGKFSNSQNLSFYDINSDEKYKKNTLI